MRGVRKPLFFSLEVTQIISNEIPLEAPGEAADEVVQRWMRVLHQPSPHELIENGKVILTVSSLDGHPPSSTFPGVGHLHHLQEGILRKGL
jgi:hypothetical protein